MHGDIETYHAGGLWHNRAEGDSTVLSSHQTKADAEAAGRQFAQDRKVEHIIRNLDGRIAEKNSYGPDPRNIAG